MGTFFWRLQLSTLCDFDHLGGLVPCAFGDILHLLDNIVAFKHFAKDDMLAIEPPVMYRQYKGRCVLAQKATYPVIAVVMKN